MKRFWFFGDSYTLGSGCGSSEPYSKFESSGLIWRTILSEKYKFEDKTFSDGGICNQEILKRFIANLSNINSGDIVIIGDTVPTRILGVSQKRETLGTPLKPLVTFNNDTLTYGLHDKDIEVSFENMETYVNYVYDFIYMYSEQWEDYYRNIIFDLKKQLESRGVEVYFWSHKLWYVQEKFHTIWKATDGQVNDHHWSYQGHKEMANYMINRIDNKIFINESEFNLGPTPKFNLDGTPITLKNII